MASLFLTGTDAIEVFDKAHYADYSADYDDEVATMEWMKRLKIGEKALIIVGGKGKIKALEDFMAGFWLPSRIVAIWDESYTPTHKFGVTEFCVTAPGFYDKYGPFFDPQFTKVVCYQGNLTCKLDMTAKVKCDFPDDSPAFNDKGSAKFLLSLPESCLVHAVTSAECLQPENLLTTDRMINELKLNEAQRDKVFSTVFNFIVGRMHPKHPYKHVASGLVDPRVKGTFYILTKSVFMKMNIETATLTSLQNAALDAAVDSYYATLGDEAKPNDDLARKYMKELQVWVYSITGEFPVREGLLLTSGPEDGTLVDLSAAYPKAFAKFKEVGIATPPYDLICVSKTFV